MKQSLIELFYLSNLLQMLNECRMADNERFGNFLCSCKKICLDNCSQLVVANFQWAATKPVIFKALASFLKLLELPLHYMFISSSLAKCIADVVNCLCCFTTHFEFELKNYSNLLFV